MRAFPRERIALPFLRGLLEPLQTLFTLELPLFGLQQPLLRALCALALRLLRLQILHALLQPVDALLALRVLRRKPVALPLLHRLLRLLNALLALADPILPGWARACRDGLAAAGALGRDGALLSERQGAVARRSAAPDGAPWPAAAAAQPDGTPARRAAP